MPLPQHIRYQGDSNITTTVNRLPSAVTAAIVDSDGTELLGHTSANISTINVALAANVTRGDIDFTVDANTGIEAGITCWLQDDPEEVLVRKVEGTKIYVRRPMLKDHINTARVEGGKITLEVKTDEDTVANTLFWDGRVEWNIDGQRQYSSIECTRYPLVRIATVQDLYDLEPKLYDILDSEVAPERLLDLGHNKVLSMIAKAAPDQRTRVFTGSDAFKTATCLAAMWWHYNAGRGEDSRELAERYFAALKDELESMVQVVPRDADQDEDIEDDERISFSTISLHRR
jgi:hypothetical protein